MLKFLVLQYFITRSVADAQEKNDYESIARAINELGSWVEGRLKQETGDEERVGEDEADVERNENGERIITFEDGEKVTFTEFYDEIEGNLSKAKKKALDHFGDNVPEDVSMMMNKRFLICVSWYLKEFSNLEFNEKSQNCNV